MKNAIVTGGSDGVGRALVKLLLISGYNVITFGRTTEKLDKLCTECKNSAGKLFTFTADVTEKDKIDEFIKFVNSNMNSVDLIVNNAGMQTGNAPLEDADPHLLDQMIEVHMTASLKLYKAFFPQMRDKKCGQIINIITHLVIKELPKATYGAYTISKYAQMGLGKMMVSEATKYNIRVTNVLLGGANTNIRPEPRPQYLTPESIAKTLLNIITVPEDVFIPEIRIHPMADLVN